MQIEYSSASKRRYKRFNNEINITPFVDVMLVLLIVFMVASPMLVSGIVSDIPEGKTKPISGSDQAITVEISANKKLFIQEQPITKAELINKITLIAQQHNIENPRIFIRGHKNIDYGSVMQIIDDISNAGFSKVALITQPK